MDFGNIEKLTKRLVEVNDGSYRKGEVWQAILNIGYNMWQSSKQDLSYSDMITWMRIEYGEFAAFCILVGKYNQQVTNGGHIQYWDNCYAGESHEDFSLHEQMLSGFRDFGLVTSTELGKKTYEVAKRFKIVQTGDLYYGDGDPYLKDDAIDDDYYKFCFKWEEFFGKVVKDAIDEQIAKEAA